MRSAFCKAALALLAFCPCLTDHAQVNPGTQIRWPVSCNAPNEVYVPSTNTCITPSGGSPGGTNTQIQFNNGGAFGGSAATLDGAGNLSSPGNISVTGTLSAGAAMSPNMNNVLYASQYAASGNGTPASPYTSASGTGGIQEAVNAAEALPPISGGFAPTVYLSPGSYTVSSSILITKGVNLIGAGWATQLLSSTSGSPTILVQPTNAAGIKGFTFTEFTIQTNASGGCGITLDGTNNSIFWGDIKHVQIYQQGSNGLCAFGSGAAQGTPALTTIEDSQIFGGISMTQGGDSVRIIHNTLSGTGSNDFGNISGAVGFIFAHNNITISGGTHFGNTVTASVNYHQVIRDNEFETSTGYTGSNGAMLDFDQNVVNPIVTGNSFVLLNGTNSIAVRLNSAVSGKFADNYFACAAGLTGSTAVSATASAAHNEFGPLNYFYPSSPCATNFNATAAQAQSITTNSGSGWYIPNGQFYGATDNTGTYRNLLEIDSSNLVWLFGYPTNGAYVLRSDSTGNYFFDETNSHNICARMHNNVGQTGGAPGGCFVGFTNLSVNTTGNFYDSSANILIPGNAGGHTGSGLVTLATNPTFASGFSVVNQLISGTAPTISSGFGTSPSVVSSNGTAAFSINVGTGGTATSGVIGFPTAAHAWNCVCQDLTTTSSTVFVTKQTAASTTSCTVANWNTSAVQAAWAASDVLSCRALAY